MVKIKKPARIATQSVAGGDEKNTVNEVPEEISVEATADNGVLQDAVKKPVEILRESNETVEKKENLPEEEIIELRKEIENMNLDDDLKLQAQSHANDIKSLDDQEKLKKLLQVAKVKGVVFAIHVAQKMNNPYILDSLHDALSEEGYYKKFIK